MLPRLLLSIILVFRLMIDDNCFLKDMRDFSIYFSLKASTLSGIMLEIKESLFD